jgi:hypothetical protein
MIFSCIFPLRPIGGCGWEVVYCEPSAKLIISRPVSPKLDHSPPWLRGGEKSRATRSPYLSERPEGDERRIYPLATETSDAICEYTPINDENTTKRGTGFLKQRAEIENHTMQSCGGIRSCCRFYTRSSAVGWNPASSPELGSRRGGSSESSTGTAGPMEVDPQRIISPTRFAPPSH